MVAIYNSLTKKIEPFKPRSEHRVQLFVCGPTVYDYIHIGNARVFVFFDVVAKYLATQGMSVDYVQNITDIDDKIIKRANETSRDAAEYAQEYTAIFLEDMKALGVTAPRYVAATTRIEQVTRQVKTLIRKGHAYLIEGDGWYFDLSTFAQYGKLSGRTALMADDAMSRIDENDKKRNAGDFCVWKLSKTDEPAWADAELGTGRPGWHIEDTAITESEFGPHYDIHGGGQDLMFPHHEAEIAQQESATGDGQHFVNYWMHVAFLVNNQTKMSKSTGNFSTVRELLKEYSPEVLRFYLLSSHYRTPLQYSKSALLSAEAAVQRIHEMIHKLNNNPAQALHPNSELHADLDHYFAQIEESLATDINIPQACGHLFEIIKKTNIAITTQTIDESARMKVNQILLYVSNILGIIPTHRPSIPPEIQSLIHQREQLRQEKQFQESDNLRDQINDLGWDIDDTAYGPVVKQR